MRLRISSRTFLYLPKLKDQILEHPPYFRCPFLQTCLFSSPSPACCTHAAAPRTSFRRRMTTAEISRARHLGPFFLNQEYIYIPARLAIRQPCISQRLPLFAPSITNNNSPSPSQNLHSSPLPTNPAAAAAAAAAAAVAPANGALEPGRHHRHRRRGPAHRPGHGHHRPDDLLRLSEETVAAAAFQATMLVMG